MKKKMDTKMLVTAAILIALNVILSRFLSINTLSLKIGFTFVTVFIFFPSRCRILQDTLTV